MEPEGETDEEKEEIVRVAYEKFCKSNMFIKKKGKHYDYPLHVK